MRELERALVADSAAAPPNHILEGLSEEVADTRVPGAPHTIYGELWHIAFWQQMTLDWLEGRETPVPEHASAGFPSEADRAAETWDALRERFFVSLIALAAEARDEARLDVPIRCPSAAGKPVRVMSRRDQPESAAVHNGYHFGRVVLLRQMLGRWPPAAGGFTW